MPLLLPIGFFQTPVVTGGGGSLLLDSVSASAAAAYSLRKLKSTYSGSAIKVRRSSDNATQDIGFDGSGNLDTSALATFVGANNGFVDTWYDQSGNARHLAQATTTSQPLIVSSGTLQTQNSKAALSFNGTSQNMQSSAVPFTTPYSLIMVWSHPSANSAYRRFIHVGTTAVDNIGFFGTIGDNFATFVGNGSSWNDVSANSANIAIGTSAAICVVTNNNTTLSPYVNNTAQTTKNGATTSTTGMNVGALYSSGTDQLSTAKCSELIVFTSVLSSGDRGTAQTDEATYYGVTLN